jgi:DNA-binding XRE family transcriptional regulator
MTFSAAQCRAARALLNWSQTELAEASKAATKTIADIEREAARLPYERTLADIQSRSKPPGSNSSTAASPGSK